MSIEIVSRESSLQNRGGIASKGDDGFGSGNGSLDGCSGVLGTLESVAVLGELERSRTGPA